MKIVEVCWDDAHVTTGETTISKSLKMKPVRTLTTAYFMSENDEGITLCTDRYEKQPKTGKIINHIPWGMVVWWRDV